MATVSLDSAFSDSISSYDQIEDQSKLVISPNKLSCVKCVNNKGELLKIKRTIKEWTEIISNRLGHSRLNKTFFPQNFIHDQAVYEDYRKVLGFVSLGIDRKARELEIVKPSEEPAVIAVIEDERQIIQGISTSTIKADQLYINALLSAPWNIQMMAPVENDHLSLKTKGSGTALMAYNYRLAQKHSKPVVSLSPLDQALPFYNKIGMKERESQYVFDVLEQMPNDLARYLPIKENEDDEKEPYKPS